MSSNCGSQNHTAYDCTKPKAAVPLEPPKELEPVQEIHPERIIISSVPLPVFEPKPRWPGAPKICTAANLPAFETEKEMERFRSQFEGFKLLKVWQCDKCNCWHYLSRSGPESVLPKDFVPFRKKAMRDSAFGQQDLKRQEQPEKPSEQKPLAKSKPKPQSKPQKNLI